MEPLNSKERTVAFWKFLMSFLLLALLFIIIVMLASDVPDVQLSELRTENQALRASQAQIPQVLQMVQDIEAKTEAYRNDSSSFGATSRMKYDQLVKQTTDLINLSSDSSDFDKLENTVGGAYINWLDAIQKVRASGGGSQKIMQLQSDLNDCQKEKQQLQSDYMFLKQKTGND